MTNLTHRRQRVVDLIAMVMNEDITSWRDLERRLACFEHELDETEAIAVHQARHYVADADIRTRDPGYAASSREELNAILSELQKSTLR